MHITNITEALENTEVDFSTVNYLTFYNTGSDVELYNKLFSKCPLVKNISINHSDLTSLPDFRVCPHLNHLMINAPIAKVGAGLQNLKELTSFQTRNWRVEDYGFLSFLGSDLTNIQILEPKNRWKNLPDIGIWPQLHYMRVDKCDDEQLCGNPSELKRLSTIALFDCRFKNLSNTLGNCPSLRSVTILKSPVLNFIDFWEKLPTLQSLFIDSTALTGLDNLPKTTVEWFNLTLRNNNHTFENLDFIDQMPKLSALDLSGNKFLSSLFFLRNRALPLRNWPIMSADFKFKDLKVFSAVGTSIAKSKLSEEDKVFFITYLKTKTKLSVNKRWDWQTILKATNISHLGFRKKVQALIDEKIADKSAKIDWTKGVVYVTGKPKMKKTELKKQVEELGMTYATKYSEKVTHIVIGMGSADYDLLADKEFIPITDAQLQQQYAETQPQFLKETAAEEGGTEMMENLGKLLTSSDVANVKIAIEMIKTGGTPPGLFEELLIVQKTTADAKIRKVVQNLLEIEAPLEWKPFVRDRLSFKMVHTNKPESDIRRQLVAVAKRITPKMAAEFSLMLFRHTGRGLRYALTSRAAATKKAAYSYLLKDHHFDFSRGLGMQRQADRGNNYYAIPVSSVALPVLVLQMDTIHSLNLHNCAYLSLDAKITEFKDLKHLDVSDNELTSLPAYFSELTNLETVDLRNHMFREFPAVLTQMTHLKKIDLRISRTDYRYGTMEIPEEFKAANPDCWVLV